ncbi:MAG: uroporphyrinogen-III synthase, partial [Nitrospirae bacterium]
GIEICCIGSSTAKILRGYGLIADLIPDVYSAEGLIELFKNDVKGRRFLLPRAEKGREDFPHMVRDSGGFIDIPTAYRTVKPKLLSKIKRLKRFLQEGRITIATFTSASTFNNLRDSLGDDINNLLNGVIIVAIGPVTAKAIESAGLKVHIIPEKATIEAMTDAIINYFHPSPNTKRCWSKG